MRKILLLSAVALSMSCADEVEQAAETAQSCGERECPAGTAFHKKRSFSGGTEIGGSFDPSGGASGAFKRFGEGDCEYVCQVISDCPEGTFPVITADCFTCGVVLSDDTVDRGACGE